jgi:hypothetical protein
MVLRAIITHYKPSCSIGSSTYRGPTPSPPSPPSPVLHGRGRRFKRLTGRHVRSFVRRIRQSPVPQACSGCERVQLGLCPAHDVPHTNSRGLQVIGNQRPMAPPPYRLRTHDARPLPTGRLEQSFDPTSEPFRLHVIRIAAEGIVSPAGISRVRTRSPSAAEFRCVHILDPDRLELGAQRVLVEMWGSARSRKTPHVNQRFDPVDGEQLDKLVEGSGGVPDRPNGQFLFVHLRPPCGA